VLVPPIPFVNSVSELLASVLGSPSSPVRQVARKAFDTMAERVGQKSAMPAKMKKRETVA
jgi:hypothetical protein